MLRVWARRVLLLEAAGLVGALGLYRKIDSEQEFRYNLHTSKVGSKVLEAYYWAHMKSGDTTVEKQDKLHFSSLDKKNQQR